MKRVLSIDGGGIRGLIPATVCEKWEQWTGYGMNQLFDLMVGTSTGALLAMALSIPPRGKSASELASFYTQHGPKIFGKPKKVVPWFWGPKHDAGPLIESVTDLFGSTRMSHALVDLLITSYDVQSCSPVYFRRQSDVGQSGDDYLMRDVAIATSAAPTYFPPALRWDRVFVDGGLVANNPANLAYAEAKRLWPDEDVLLVSLGTGTLSRPRWIQEVRRWGKLEWAQPAIDLMFDGTARATEDFFRYAHASQYWRFQTALSESTQALDDASTASLTGLRRLGEDLARNREHDLMELGQLLYATTSLEATIENPEPHQVVAPGLCHVSGTISGYGGENLYLLTGSDRRYWPSARLIPNRGRWHGEVNFGRGTATATITVIAANQNFADYIEFYREHRAVLEHAGMTVTNPGKQLASVRVVVDRGLA